MIETTIEKWHRHLRGDLPGGLDELLHDDCVFWSPVVFAGQQGKELTKLYLGAAAQVLPGDTTAKESSTGGFRYVKQVLDGNHAVLEFESTMGDTHVNGVDIITCDDDGRIVEFKVMVRPLRAVNEIHARMAAMLETMS
jgi:SnoaL-like domain